MNKRFPQYLTSPFQVLWFETDQLAAILLFLVLGLVFGGFWWIAVFVGPWFYGKMKAKYPRGFLRHLLYFAGITTMKGYPIYFEKEFTE